jgi:hypothetical protein
MRYTIETAKDLFAKSECKLLEKKYINSSTSMSYICSCGKPSSISLSDFKRGRRCRDCGNKKAGKSRQDKAINQNDLIKYFENQGCKLLSQYSGYNDPLKYLCNCGEEGNTTWWSFQKGTRCGRCLGKRKKQYSIDEVKKIFLNQNCELLQEHYEGVGVPLKYKCSCGNKSKITLGNFKKGSRCKQCGFKKAIGEGNHRWIKDRKIKKENDLFRLKCLSILHRCLKCFNKIKDDRTYKMLGYTNQQLKEHIQAHPNWEKLKKENWHIDHIFPIKAFFEHNIFDLKIINHLDNLRPLSQKENSKKSAKYNKQQFVSWLQNHGVKCKHFSIG